MYTFSSSLKQVYIQNILHNHVQISPKSQVYYCWRGISTCNRCCIVSIACVGLQLNDCPTYQFMHPLFGFLLCTSIYMSLLLSLSFQYTFTQCRMFCAANHVRCLCQGNNHASNHLTYFAFSLSRSLYQMSQHCKKMYVCLSLSVASLIA